jgi:hypothetical protein
MSKKKIFIKKMLLEKIYSNNMDRWLICFEKLLYLCLDGNIFTDLMKNQILSLIICIRQNRKQTSTKDENTIMFTNLFTMFTNLQYLNYRIPKYVKEYFPHTKILWILSIFV